MFKMNNNFDNEESMDDLPHLQLVLNSTTTVTENEMLTTEDLNLNTNEQTLPSPSKTRDDFLLDVGENNDNKNEAFETTDNHQMKLRSPLCCNCSSIISEDGNEASRQLNDVISCSIVNVQERKLEATYVKLANIFLKLFSSNKDSNYLEDIQSLRLCGSCVEKVCQLYNLYNKYISLSLLSNSPLASFLFGNCEKIKTSDIALSSNDTLLKESISKRQPRKTDKCSNSAKRGNKVELKETETTFRNTNVSHSSTIVREKDLIKIKSGIPIKCGTPRNKIVTTMSSIDPEHEYSQGPDGSKTTTCDRCGKTFNSSIGLRVHYASHVRDDNKFKCTECGKKFRKKDALTLHARTEHEGFKPHKCLHEGCNRSFRLKDKLKLHIQVIHDKRKPFPCPKCEKSFRTKYHLKVHDVAKHVQGDSSLGCSQCKRKFSCRDSLTVHLKTHEENKPFNCNICLKGFQTTSRLKLHKKSHEIIPSCICSVCGKAYKHARDLRLHEVIHQDESTYRFACGDCPKKFYRIDLLRVHQSNKKHFSPEKIGPSISKTTKITPNNTKKRKRTLETEKFDEELQIYDEIETGPSNRKNDKKKSISGKYSSALRKTAKGATKPYMLQTSLYQPNLPEVAFTSGVITDVMGSSHKGHMLNPPGESLDDLLGASSQSNLIPRNLMFPVKDINSTDRGLSSFFVAAGAEQIGFDVISEFMNNYN